MKFQTILLLSAAVTLAYADALEVSENENDAANSLDAAGINSEPETDDTLSKEPDTPAEDNSPIDSTPVENTPDDAEAASNDITPNENAEADTPNENAEADTPGENADAAEGSDDYGDDNKVDDADANAIDANEDSAADDENAAAAEENVNEAGENSEGEEDGNGAEIAAGIAGAAALSSAGIFFWVKKSKRNNLENAPLNMV